ncbi:hypothetical protein BW723_00680 [Polaribacter reichenbachii]|uniref:Magnesium citrate secondary transporter n=1 Tax=Polaribacter reichenbachii TaxID=996801 RepID=A0A1B8U4R6_9FLAO|nr:hypothetical protein [Polaribacter reichenbachii]APZ44890.1 hypothetical protein BW723_00680 [Polaribacter reichenbachii]AUC18754.1 hypothetical protein BTO17_08685 [Polaribacter reichenbachii]OBY66868.1 hypothetical protein LPB301_05425 [Polaribacter reichenbachii]
MNKKLSIYCISSILLGITIYLFQYFNISLPKIINNYLNDFLIIAIVLYISLLFLRWSRNNSNFTLTLSIILYVCFMYSILFEFVFPNYLARYTKDYVDIILYFASGYIFYKLQNKLD